MSETGSFHLPPPQPTVTPTSDAAAPNAAAEAAQPPAPHPAFTGGPRGLPPDRAPGRSQYPAPHGPPLTARSLAPSPARRADVPTAAYTARNPRSAPPAQHRGARRRRRPGPPARVALPVLLLALACYAVGFWALTRI